MGFSSAVQSLIDKLQGWVNDLILLIPNLVVAILVLIIFWIVARIIYRTLKRLVVRVSSNTHIGQLLATTAYIAVLLAGVFAALGILELQKTVVSLLAGVGIIGLALGFAFQDIAENFIAGILMAVRKPFAVGDLVSTNDYMGRVMEINLRSTMIETPQGQIVLLPNSKVFEDAIVNYTSPGKRRVDLSVGVSYGDDLEKARKVAIEAVESVPSRNQDRPAELFYEGFGDSSINFVVRFWLPNGEQKQFLQARSDAIMRIHKAFDEQGLTIPFPIRTLDFGIVGGKELSQSLAEVKPLQLGSDDRQGGNATPQPPTGD